MVALRLIHWNTREAEERASSLIDLGYEVDFSPINNISLRELWSNPPSVIVIDLTRLPSQGRDIAVTIRKRKATRQVPLVFAGGTEDKITRIQQILPDAHFANWETISDAITHALLHPIENPVVPESGMAAYAGTPLPVKLGMQTGSKICLINAPPDFNVTLGNLPANVIVTDECHSSCDLNLWFVRTLEELLRDIKDIVQLSGGVGLWIIWPKKSSKKTGLSQTVVRKTGMDAGLVDYKIASINQKWSGLRFTQKK